ncbi:MAG TPA: TrpB-like pyridoxal phosphate-dependent enzyme [Candidatus Omnitrophota bacterium]|nr:TrpB-like pyridoxal phosphate-dependent enzyme [Candidatus Omnitrophota bacterium]HPS20161.1 TrpB-like pyridoxal phosphate-dependent enzyme [Candidatus Omnitrophota bacterium]
MEDYKILLGEREIPDKWYNIQADLPVPLKPPLNPKTGKPISPMDLSAIFPMGLIEQEMSVERYIEIPDEVREVYKIWRPSPLRRARNLEKFLKTPARIYYKDESLSPPGSHKPNTAVAQVYYNKKEGVRRISTETGAGQWGCALSFACNIFGLKCEVYMVRVSYDQKPYRKFLMHLWGADVYASPSTHTENGKRLLAEHPDTTGSLGMAISEAVEVAVKNPDTKYALGSVLNHVLLHQTVTGLETKKQLRIAGERHPDVLIGCCGGGSNFAGLVFPFVKEKIDGHAMEIIGVEPSACPTLTRAPYRYDFGDTAQMTPLLMMHTLGHSFVPPGIHAGGLRYHGMAPLVSLLVDQGLVAPRAYHQTKVFEAAMMFAKTEGFIPAPETSHAIRAAIDEAIRCREEKKEKSIVFLYSGHGHFDLASYDQYMSGALEDYELPDSLIKEAQAHIPIVH